MLMIHIPFVASALLIPFRSAQEATGVAHGRAVALASLTLGSAGLTAVLSGLRTRAARVVVAATVAVSFILIQAPALAHLLHLEPLHLYDWGIALGGSILAVLPLALDRVARRSRTGS